MGGATVTEKRPGKGMLVKIEYFTDPLCSWSWGFEPQWRRLRYEFAGQVCWRYRMGGMIPDWGSYSDPMNSVHRPVQMAPQWLEVRHLTGMPVDASVWIADPPQSSYPACVAVKAAELQSPQAAERYLRRLREGVMMHRQNISRREALINSAEEVASEKDVPFVLQQFIDDLNSDKALEAFREDLKIAAYRNIGRFPTLVMQCRGDAVMIVGYRPYSALITALSHLAPSLRPTRSSAGAEDYQSFWGTCSSRELAEAGVVGSDTVIDPAIRVGTPLIPK